ncbi:MAG: hypothetical protein VXW22_02235, partial [Pseudomonadota bacterium]|nr:hypothetical protein [Pseudomonadota bacterium]
MVRLDAENDAKPMAEPNAFLEEALFNARTIMLTGGVDDKLARVRRGRARRLRQLFEHVVAPLQEGCARVQVA